ncbi:helix-turn-helix domain-containing protein [uncultured Sphingomonas sp.]|uniref:MarR family transcriptional regulator n=1 Tax=uncultured Sphingomonas sp. TaxID=158754 RepID=UPI00261830A3|nr:helix-turn-helix domain-containing protein [uncultured Sphingomonas sp.]
MAKPVNMTALNQSASAQFLREPELRKGMELMYFGNSHIVRSIDRGLAAQGLGRAHHRALYFIARRPDMTVSELLSILAITKQSLGRVLNELTERGLLETRPGDRDRRQRLLRLTSDGLAMESTLFEALREKLSLAYARAGQQAVTGFWTVLEGLIPEEERAHIEKLRLLDTRPG